jgi:tetratricopeptide (TPR) repeat protein
MEPELEYLFRHALVQEAAYDSILKSDRKHLHLAVAREMERIYPERLDELAALLANHYREASETQQALEYYKRAADHAFNKFANSEAEYNLRAALELCHAENERANLNLQLGFALTALGKLDEAEKSLREALPAYRANNQSENAAVVYSNLAQIYWAKGDQANSLAVAREGLQEVGELPPSKAYAELLRYTANGCVFTDLLEEAQVYTAKALAIAEQCNAKSALAQALVTQALIEDRLGKTGEAIHALERAIINAEESRSLFALARARNNLAYMYVKLGRNEEAAKQCESMVETNRKANSIVGEIWFLSQLNNAYLDLGRIDEAVALIEVIQDLFETSGGKPHHLQVEQAKISTLIYTGKPAEALTKTLPARDNAVKHDDKQMMMNLSHSSATAYAMLKDYKRAAQEMEFGIQQAGIWAGPFYQYLLASYQARSDANIITAQESFLRAEQATESIPTFAETTARLYALLHIRAREEKFDETLSIAAELSEKYRGAKSRWLYALVLWDAGEIALKANDKTKAKRLLQQALNEYQETHIPIYAAQIREILDTL